MEYRYTPQGVCSIEMIFEIDKNTIKNLEIVGGCPGNTVGVSKLVEGRTIDEVIKMLNKREEPIVFILWGNYSKEKSVYITNPKHYVIESVHPSPFSARNGFFGSKPFSKTNEFLKSKGIKEINWRVE